MKTKDAIVQIDNGYNVSTVREKFIEEYQAKINYNDGVDYNNIRKRIESKYTAKLAELSFAYYVFWKRKKEYTPTFDCGTDMATFEEYTKLCDNIETDMRLELYDENERTREYSKLKSDFERKEEGAKSQLEILREKKRERE